MVTTFSIFIIGAVAAIYIIAGAISLWTALANTPATRAEHERTRDRETFRLVLEQQERAIQKLFPAPKRARGERMMPGQVKAVPS